MHIRRLRIPGHANGPDPALTAQAKTQHHDQGQCQAIRAQLYRLPSPRRTPQLPTIGVAAQAAKRLRVRQQNLPRQHPKAMQQAAENAERAGPGRNGQ